MATLRTGGDVDSYCTKCRMLLGHTILAMVGNKIARVRCNTCMGEHAYKSGPPGSVTEKAPKAGRKSPAPGRATRTKVEHKTFEQLLANKNEANAKNYTPRERFTEGNLIRHPSFGLGIVQLVRDDKIDVLFASDEKTLLHGRGEPAKPADGSHA